MRAPERAQSPADRSSNSNASQRRIELPVCACHQALEVINSGITHDGDSGEKRGLHTSLRPAEALRRYSALREY